MNEPTSQTLERLRTADAVASLAQLIVDDLLARPPAEVVDARFSAELIQRTLQGWLGSDIAEQRLLETLESVREGLARDDRPLGDVVPDEVTDAVRALAAKPYSPDRGTLLAIVDRDPVRKLVREILRETLVDFGKKLRAPVAGNSVAKSLGGLGRFARDRAARKSGSIGALAGGLVGAVSEEVERQIERRAADFADGAISGVLHRFADELCDPKRVDDQAALRGAVLDGLFSLRGVDAAKELNNADPAELVATLRAALSSWAERDDFAEQVESFVDAALAEVDAPTLGDLLDRADLRETATSLVVDVLQRRLGPLFESDAFGAWFLSLSIES